MKFRNIYIYLINYFLFFSYKDMQVIVHEIGLKY